MAQITLLDGGMGQELVHRAGDNPTPLWSTQVMIEHPGLVEAVHKDYFEAGATIATTNTYAIHHDRLIRAGIDDQFETLQMAALNEARRARTAFGSGRVAGSIGPLNASYRPDLHPPHDRAVALYAEVAQLQKSVVDLIICETVASVAHARAVLEGAKTAGCPVWLALTLDDEDGHRLRSGESVADAMAVAESEGADAILANCSIPEVMAAALDVFATGKLPFGAYANGFTHIASKFLETAPTVDALSARKDLGPVEYTEFALGWVNQGATIVGGCCEVGPSHIAALNQALMAAGHEIV